MVCNPQETRRFRSGEESSVQYACIAELQKQVTRPLCICNQHLVEKWMSHFCWKNLLVWIYSRLVCVIPLKTPKISRLPRVVLIAPRPSGTRGRLRPASGPVGKKVSSASSSMTVRLTYCIRHGHCRRPLPSEPKRCYCFKDKGP
jgi:hypothetical protein